MRIPIDKIELNNRIELNLRRLADGECYHIDQVFSSKDYEWPRDKEGRALLAFASHYKISGIKIPCMEQMLEKMEPHMNSESYFSPICKDEIHEQQLSGHSWLLRGLCEYQEAFGSKEACGFFVV